MRQRGVLLINLGTPDEPDVPAVRRYLTEFLSDPEVIRLPRGLGWLNTALARTLSRFRAARSVEKYKKIWTDRGSPLRTITDEQVSALEPELPNGMRVYSAMRYGKPSIPEVLRTIEAQGIEELVVVPMYPQYCGPTTRTAVRELYRYVHDSGCRLDVTTRCVWFDDAGYINAQAKRLHDHCLDHGLTPENTHLLFSAHALPVKYVERGDPYEDQITQTAELVARRLGWPTDQASLAYQSRLGPVKWLRPSTAEALEELAAAGTKQVLVCPLSFTTDCLESLEEIGIRYRAQFERAGGRLHLCPALNAYEPFIAALKNLVIHGRHPMTMAMAEANPLMGPRDTDAATEPDSMSSLVMVGMSLGAPLGTGKGPNVNPADEDGFRKAKRSQCDVPEVLREISDGGDVREALLWNTCRRFELYAWLAEAPDEAERARVVQRIRHRLFENGLADAPTVNVLLGSDAHHHLMRTAVGLNSTLPGERDVIEQLQAAHRLAQRTGTSGPLSERLLADAVDTERELRDETEWGRFDPDYCYASLRRIVEMTGLDLPDCRSTVIGGSTTSCGILKTLVERFEVSHRMLTLLHRGHGHGGHLKMLRKAIGHGRRIRVGSYSEKAVIQAIADSDILFLGIDCKEPVLTAEQIRGCRDFTARPLTIIDFNMFSSTVGMEELDGVRLFKAADLEEAVAVFAERMTHEPQFARAVQSAESWIINRLKPPRVADPGGGQCESRRSTLSEGVGRTGNAEAQVQEMSDTQNENGVDIEVFRRYAGLSLPRHVSYPMPSWWHDIEAADLENMLRQSENQTPACDLSLYVHVPFCESLCKFCACNRVILRKTAPRAADRVEDYLRAMQREMSTLAERLSPGRRVRQIHWGGGSPTYLSPDQIGRLCGMIRETFEVADDAEIAMEVDPRRCSRSLFEALRSFGFNRLSMGVQDFDEQVQKHVCRNQPFSLVRDTIDMCRELEFASVNFDLIYGLPYQTLASVRETIERTIEVSPDRIAFYHYAQIPEKIATQRGMHHEKMPDSETKLKMFLAAVELFEAAGYRFIGLDHFAKPDEALAHAHEAGTLQRTFQGMTTGGGLDLIGLGASSISNFSGVGMAQNVRSADEYVQCLERGGSVVRKGKFLTEDDRIRQRVMNQLYCSAEIRPEPLEEQFGIDFADYFRRELEIMRELEANGLVTLDADNTIRTTYPLGRVLLRTVAAPFDAYLDKDAYRVGDQHMFSANA